MHGKAGEMLPHEPRHEPDEGVLGPVVARVDRGQSPGRRVDRRVVIEVPGHQHVRAEPQRVVDGHLARAGADRRGRNRPLRVPVDPDVRQRGRLADPLRELAQRAGLGNGPDPAVAVARMGGLREDLRVDEPEVGGI